MSLIPNKTNNKPKKDKPVWYQILFQPKKGQLFTVITWIFIIVLLYLIINTLTSCNKTKYNVRFNANTAGFKDSDSITSCKAVIDNDTFDLNVFYDNGSPYSETFETSIGTHFVTSFIVYNENNIIGACPIDSSEYSIYVNDPLPISFEVDEQVITEIPIDVIMNNGLTTDLTNFGYGYFGISTANLKEVSFYAMKGTADSILYHYIGSDYNNQYNPLQNFMNLYYYIDYQHKNVGEGWQDIKWYRSSYGQDGYLYNVKYIDYDNKNDSSRFVLECNVYNPYNNSMSWITSYPDWIITISSSDTLLNNGDFTTIGLAPDSTWFPNVNYFFNYNY